MSVLVACGGGGGGDTVATPAAPSWAASGSYSPVLKVEGSASTTPVAIALSLVHPSRPDVEYVIDASAAPTALGLVLQKGSYDSVRKQVAGLTPVAYIDSPNGTLRMTSLAADGRRPLQLHAGSRAVCASNIPAYNFADPFASQIAVMSPGADGACETADDTQSLVTFSSIGGPNVASYALGKMLGYLASAATGQPTGWLVGSPTGQLTLAHIGASNDIVLSLTTFPPPTTVTVFKPVQNLNDLILFTQDGALRSLNATANPPTLNNLSALTGPEGWQSAGSDASHAYVYLNSAAATSGLGTWRMLAISRSTQSVTTLATGTGSILAAQAAAPRIFVTLFNGASSSVVQVATANGAQTLFVPPSTTSATLVTTSPAGFHVVSNISGVAGVPPSLSIIDNAGVAVYPTTNGLVYGIDQRQYDVVTNSLLPSDFLITTPRAGTVFSGSSLASFEPASRTSRTLGSFPTGSSLGGGASDAVFVGPLLPNNGFGGTHAARLAAGQIQATGSAVYTFNTNVANSLTRTTLQVR